MVSILKIADDPRVRWDSRIRRARILQDRYEAAATPLRFYEQVLGFQRGLARDYEFPIQGETPLREQIELPFLLSRFPAILDLAIAHGPETLRDHARSLRAAGETSWESVLQSAVREVNGPLDSSARFFAHAILQPAAENLQLQLSTELVYSKSVCPACGGLPLLAILKPEGEGASRWLQCSFCLREWLYRRVICPYCAEENKEKLPRYSEEECEHVLIEACDTCHRYLKAVNLAVEGHADPLIDEAALAVLDVWAAERGYTKIASNLIGF